VRGNPCIHDTSRSNYAKGLKADYAGILDQWSVRLLPDTHVVRVRVRSAQALCECHPFQGLACGARV